MTNMAIILTDDRLAGREASTRNLASLLGAITALPAPTLTHSGYPTPSVRRASWTISRQGS